MMKIDIDNERVFAAAQGSGKQIVEELGQAVYAITVKLFADFPESARNHLESTLNIALISSIHKAREKNK